MSSRNAYLSPENRQRALGVSRSLREAARLVSAGERNAATLLLAMRKVLEEAGITEIDYVALVNPETLENLSEVSGPALAVLAVRVGTTRLIDNELLLAERRP
jgi:pantoate--beta-alanine ligase